MSSKFLLRRILQGILLCVPLLTASASLRTAKKEKFDKDEVVSRDPRVLNVHVVPHTHDDVGWLKTVDQYYYGLNNTIQHAAVKYILDNTIKALEANPARKFTYVEMAYFNMWWFHQNEEKRRSVKKLVQDGQLAFVNGGWCMHDEAATHFMGMIDQTTLGHRFLEETFDYIPRVGWQVDPFGHSATQASLLTAEVGFDAIYFGRIDHQDLEKRLKETRCEGLWAASASLGGEAEVFWGLTGSYKGNYQPPSGFDFGVNDEPIVEGINVDQRVADFVSQISWQAERTRGNNIMLTMGSDFQYENAMEQFDQLDSLIHYVNMSTKIDSKSLGGEFDSVNIFYSNPEIYTTAKHGEGIEWEVKTDDFFPYSDCPDCFWTGFYTSRPALKRLERVASSFLHAARQIEVLQSAKEGGIGGNGSFLGQRDSPLRSLDYALGIAQHHDGVSGTSKQHVAYDYALRLDNGIKKSAKYVGSMLAKLLGVESVSLVYCQDLNVTKCDTTQAATTDIGTDIYVVVYNALSSSREDVISIPVSIDATYEVHRIGEKAILDSALLPSYNDSHTEGAAGFSLYFSTGEIPPVGAVTLRVTMVSKDSSVIQPRLDFPLCEESENVGGGEESGKKLPEIIDNGIIRISIDRSNGMLTELSSKGKSVNLKQEWGYYTSFASGKGQNSGAYIFRPKEASESLNVAPGSCLSTTVYTSNIVTEVHQVFASWIRQVTRLKKGSTYIEVEYTVGPIYDEDGKGREVVTRYHSSVRNADLFYTDSNGREFLRRRRGFRPTWDLNETQPIAGNYYPVNAAIYIEDSESSLSILTDRSQGGSSLSEGTIELMVHRRTKADDHRGVGEAIDETDGGINPYPPYGNNERQGKGIVITGSHRIITGSGDDGAANARAEMDGAFSALHLFFAAVPAVSLAPVQQMSFSALRSALPENVMIVTFAKVHSKADTVLLRLGHQYAVGEGPLATTVKVDLAKVFSRHNILSLVEKTLSGNQDRSSWEERKLWWDDSSTSGGKESNDRCTSDDGSFVLHVQPMKICTVEMVLENTHE